jgi:hypothetical protein
VSQHGLRYNSGKRPTTGKNDPHGDSGRALEKANKQVEELRKKLESAKGKEAAKIKQKMRNVIETAKKKRKGESHWN